MKVKFFISIILLVSLNSCLIKRMSYHNLNVKHKSDVFDAVIVPGFPYFKDGNNDVLKMRILWAKALYDMGKAKHIIFTGSAVSTEYKEALVMKKIAIDLGVPDSVIFLELKAEHSTENIYYSMKICEENNFTRIALATDVVQTFMLKNYINNYFPYIANLPIHYDQINMQKDLSYIDVSDCKVADFIALKNRKTKEEIAFASKGNNIDTTGYYLLNANFTASLNK